ncbi:MAG TPA: ATP-binding protein [Syntrophobacteraceae bacterium]|nr:ATP-binding protein [Syntrophobacteraceae bacterium]
MAEELFRKAFMIYGGNFDRAGESSTQIKEILESLHIDATIIRRTSIVAFEAEMNVVMYAHSAKLDLIITEDYICLEILDEGPGIPDIEQAMQEGFSTASDEMREMGFGFGMGLPNIKKNSHDLTIESNVGKGTKLSARIRLNADAGTWLQNQ